ncbi:carboxypeptidase regulatory-like domain-containing protein [Roseiconus nitratireducens]|uniref:Carboxypeptidase regulatory-like domain-containing protein n=1 Tax=Roseiconus nitratireducens TaxID=2605748 RepID=A0A5M6CYH1_9BACT|nr:carboxypeptidase-like regulatory domain-containing protein [Roseiconus nitratireducens]KAA5539470.1 carboxypeptidase regulatory-like domain-containing protein [Roseiconus nitratireducens]
MKVELIDKDQREEPSLGFGAVAASMFFGVSLLMAANVSVQAQNPPQEQSTQQSEISAKDSQATYRGRILLADGSPSRSKGYLYITARSERGSYLGTVGEFQDSFEFKSLAGKAFLAFFADGYAPTWTEPMDIQSGRIADGIELTLKPGVPFSIAVHDQSGSPISNASVAALPMIHGSSMGPLEWHSVDDSGVITLSHLAETEYTFRVKAPGFQDFRSKPKPVSADERVTLKMQRASVSPKQNDGDEKVDRKREWWTAVGRVTNADGEPLEDVTVRVATGLGTLIGGGTTKTNSDGRYEVHFGPGILFGDITDETPSPQTQVALIYASLENHFERNLCRQGRGIASLLPVPEKQRQGWGVEADQVCLPDAPREVDFVMMPAARVRGTLVDEKNAPLSDYSVSLTGEELPPGSSVLAQVLTDTEGRFEIQQIPTNKWFQFVVRKPREQLQPPWNDSWASGPIVFADPGENDFRAAVPSDPDSTDRLTAESFRLKINGAGVHGKTAVKWAKDDPLPRPAGQAIRSAEGPDASGQTLARYTLELENVERGPSD